MRTLVFIVSLAILAACTNATQTEALRGREWQLVSIGPFSSVPAGVATPTIRFEAGGRFSGQTGCNSASGDYEAGDHELRVAVGAMTRRACAEQVGNEIEAAYVNALIATQGFRIVDGQLELLNAADDVMARFK